MSGGVSNSQTQREILDALRDVAGGLRDLVTASQSGTGAGGAGGVTGGFLKGFEGTTARKAQSVFSAAGSSAGKVISNAASRTAVNYLRGQSLGSAIEGGLVSAAADAPIVGALIRPGVEAAERAGARAAGLILPQVRAGKGRYVPTGKEIGRVVDYFLEEERPVSEVQTLIDDAVNQRISKEAGKSKGADKMSDELANVIVFLSDASIEELASTIRDSVLNALSLGGYNSARKLLGY